MIVAIILNLTGYPAMQVTGNGLFLPAFLTLLGIELILGAIASIKTIRSMKASLEEVDLAHIGVWLHFLETEPKDETFRANLEWIINYHPFFSFSYQEYLSEMELINIGMDRGR